MSADVNEATYHPDTPFDDDDDLDYDFPDLLEEDVEEDVAFADEDATACHAPHVLDDGLLIESDVHEAAMSFESVATCSPCQLQSSARLGSLDVEGRLTRDDLKRGGASVVASCSPCQSNLNFPARLSQLVAEERPALRDDLMRGRPVTDLHFDAVT